MSYASAIAKAGGAGGALRLAIVALVVMLGLSAARGIGEEPPAMRRLTQEQYRNSISDIFGADTNIVGRFEPDIRLHGLIAIGSGQVGISPAGLEQYDGMARFIAEQALSPERRGRIMTCEPRGKRFDRRCAGQVLGALGERLYRRPLDAGELKGLVGAAERSAALLGGFHAGLRATLGAMLVSPDFLYRIDRARGGGGEPGELDAFSKATRLSYFLTNSTPDAELLAAARSGVLDDAEGYRRQVDRLLGAPSLERGVRAFFWDMLQFDRFATLSKDAQIYPVFSPKLAEAAEEQTLRQVVDHLVARGGDYRDLFTSRETWLNRQLGMLYDVPVRSRTEWERHTFPESADRAGWLTDVSFLALNSHPGRSSPTLRGKGIREIFLCQPIPPPPPNVDFTVVQNDSNPTMRTARERLTAHRTQPSCSGCHKLMDPLGLSLERFDGAGQRRETENGAAIDLEGAFDGRSYRSAAGLGEALRASPRVNSCLVGNMYRYALGRDSAAADKAPLAALLAQFGTDGFRVPALMRRIAMSRQFQQIAPAPAPAASRTALIGATRISHGKAS